MNPAPHLAEQSSPILVIGSSGKTGRRVVERLRARGLAVREATRSTQVPFDWSDRATWAGALEGSTAAYLTYAPDLGLPQAEGDLVAFSELALAHGVRRLVLLSSRGEAGAQRTEQALRNSGTDWTVLRASWFFQNFSESFLFEALMSGQVALPNGAVPEPFVDADDIADVVVATLTDPAHIHQTYTLTGPRALSFAQALAELSQVSGRPIGFMSITPEEFHSGLTAQGSPPDLVALMTDLLGEVLDGRNSEPTQDVWRVLERTPRDFSEYIQSHAAAGVWGSASQESPVQPA